MHIRNLKVVRKRSVIVAIKADGAYQILEYNAITQTFPILCSFFGGTETLNKKTKSVKNIKTEMSVDSYLKGSLLVSLSFDIDNKWR